MDGIHTNHVLITNYGAVMPINIRVLPELSYYRIPMEEIAYWYSMETSSKMRSSKTIYLLSIF